MKQVFILLLAVTGVIISQAQNSVGIGTTAPHGSALLDVTSTTKGILVPRMTAAQRTAISAPANGLLVYETTTNSLWIYNGTSWVKQATGDGGTSPWIITGNHITNSNSGNVGIGISAPTAKLHVTGDFLQQGGDITIDDATGSLYFRTANATQGQVQLKGADHDVSVGTFFTNSTGNLLLETQSFPRVTIEPAGDVGIGTTAPAHRLDVAGNIRSRRNIFVDSSITADGSIKGAGLTSTAGLTVSQASIFGGGVFGVSSAQFNGEITSTTGMTINDAAGTLTLKTGTDDKGFLQLSGDDLRIGTFSSNPAGKLHIRTGGSNNLTVTSDGNTGIGTISPTSKLHVAGRGLFKGAGEVLAIDGTSNPNIGFYNNGIFKSFISQTPSELYIGVNSPILRLDAPQIVVGSGAAANGYRLSIRGKIICEEMKVQLTGSWPDYVFDETYKRPSLLELNKFIKANRHLPNIPAAAEIEKGGFDIGDMQKRMMEKIEELTLYIIDQQKQIDELKAGQKK